MKALSKTPSKVDFGGNREPWWKAVVIAVESIILLICGFNFDREFSWGIGGHTLSSHLICGRHAALRPLVLAGLRVVLRESDLTKIA